MRPLAALLLLALLAALGAPAAGSDQDSPSAVRANQESRGGAGGAAALPASEQAELIDRIVALRRQLDELESRLSPEAREVLEAKLAELEASKATLAVAAAEPELALPEPLVSDARSPRPACNTLVPFDTSADGAISAVDRYWRYLGLWIDGNGNGLREDDEVTHPFDLGIVEISVDLKRFRSQPPSDGEIRRGDRLYFERIGKRNQTGVLTVDATRIRRGDGLDLRSADGVPIEGLQEFAPGMTIIGPAGERTVVNCP